MVLTGRWLMWTAATVVLAALPLVFKQSFALTLMSQMGIMVIFALSYNMLLGQSGMLSFGHAVYAGLGAFIAVHALNMIGKGTLSLPVTLLPLVGGFAGMLFGVLFGYVTTRKSGTTFAMISLGIGEMVAASSLMLPGFFGGEGGITTNRVVGGAFLGITYGPAIQVYYLIAAWALAATAAMYAFTHTPLGRMANAVRDNAQRAEFIGYDTQKVRFLTLVLSAFFAGISGGLSAINFEIVNAENVGVMRSGGVLLATFIGGTGYFLGPVLGAICYTFFVVAIAGWSKAWLLYLGLAFMIMVMFAPGGLARIATLNLQALRLGYARRLALPYATGAATGALALAGFIALVEMLYHYQLEAVNDPVLPLFGLALDVKSPQGWIAAAAVFVLGALACWPAWRRVRALWDDIHVRLAQSAP